LFVPMGASRWAMRLAGLISLGVIGEILLRNLKGGNWGSVGIGLGLTAFAIIVLPRLLMPLMWPEHADEVRKLREDHQQEQERKQAKQRALDAALAAGGPRKKMKKHLR
jgi:hypothetical protein